MTTDPHLTDSSVICARSPAGLARQSGAFEQRARELSQSNKPVRTVQPDEVAAIREQYATDSERLAALKLLAEPRLAYEWLQAGGSPILFSEAGGKEALESARLYYQSHYARNA